MTHDRKARGRVVFLAREWGARVRDALPPEGARTRLEDRLSRDPDGAFRHLARMDPTPRKACLQRLCRWFVDGGFRMEDGRRIRDTLARFEAEKHRLPVELRDLNRHRHPGDVEEALDDLDGIRRADPLAFANVPPEAAAECVAVADGRGWLIVRLDGLAASAHFADGTSWCTRHKGMFDSYRGKGPIYVMAGRGARIQVHMASGQVMDERDRRAGPQSYAAFPPEAAEAMAARLLADFQVADGSRTGAPVFPLEGGQWSVIENVESRGRRGAGRDFRAAGYGFVRADGLWALSWHAKDGRTAFHVQRPDQSRLVLDAGALLADEEGRTLLEQAFAAHLAPARVILALGDATPRLALAIRAKGETLRVALALVDEGVTDARASQATAALAGAVGELARDMAESPAEALDLLSRVPPGHPAAGHLAAAASRPAFGAAVAATREKRVHAALRAALLTRGEVDARAFGGLVAVATHPGVRASLVPAYAWDAETFISHLHLVSSSPNRSALLPVYGAFAAEPDLAGAVTEGLRDDVGLLVQTLMLLDRLDGDPEVQGIILSLTAVAASRVEGGERMFAVPPEEVLGAIRDGRPLPSPGDVFPASTLAEMVLASHAGLSMPAGEARDVLLARARPCFARVAKAVGYEPGLRLLIPHGGAEVDRADVIEVLSTPFAGHLVAALPEGERDADLFEAAAAKGRGGAISALPARLVEPGIVGRLLATGEVLPMVERACASDALVEAVRGALAGEPSATEAGFVNVASAARFLGNGGIPELVPVFAAYEETHGKGPEPDRDAHLETDVILRLAHGQRLAEAFLPPVLDGRIRPPRISAVLSQAVGLRPGLLDEVPGLAAVLSPQERVYVVQADAGAARHFGVDDLVPEVMAGFARQAGDGIGVDAIGERLGLGPSGLEAWTIAVERAGRSRSPRQSQARDILSCCPEPRGRELSRACVALAAIGGLKAWPRTPDGRRWGVLPTLRVAGRALAQAGWNPVRLMEGTDC